MNKLIHNLKQFLISFDQFCNVIISSLIGQYSWADETLSAHAHRMKLEDGIKWPSMLIDAILFFDPNHCEVSYESEVLKRQMPPGMRQDLEE